MKKEYLSHATFRFYQELNDFLPKEFRQKPFVHTFFGKPTVKDTIETLGVPHTEIDLILVNGNSVDFDFHLHEGDFVSVYPRFESLDVTSLVHLRPKALRETRFIADVHLGKLTRYLRLLGFDTFFDPHKSDEEIMETSLNEKRIILTRDLGILKNRKVTHGYWVRSTAPKMQIREIVRRFDLAKNFQPFTRCLECNTPLISVEKEKIQDQLLPDTRDAYISFFTCPSCKRIYWEGSHHEKMTKFIQSLIKGS